MEDPAALTRLTCDCKGRMLMPGMLVHIHLSIHVKMLVLAVPVTCHEDCAVVLTRDGRTLHLIANGLEIIPCPRTRQKGS